MLSNKIGLCLHTTVCVMIRDWMQPPIEAIYFVESVKKTYNFFLHSFNYVST